MFKLKSVGVAMTLANAVVAMFLFAGVASAEYVSCSRACQTGGNARCECTGDECGCECWGGGNPGCSCWCASGCSDGADCPGDI